METAIATTGLFAFLTEMLAPLLLCSSIPLGSPPVQDPALTRVAPEQCIYYVGWAGIGTPDAKSPNRAERFLADPEIRHMRAEAARRVPLLLKSLAKSTGKSAPTTIEESLAKNNGKKAPDVIEVPLVGLSLDPVVAAFWSDLLVTRPCAFFISSVDLKRDKTQVNGAFVVHVGDAGEKVAALLKQTREQASSAISETVVEGCVEYRMKGFDVLGEFRWSLRGEHLICTCGSESPSGIVKRMDGEQPAWFTAIDADLPIERRAAVLRVDCAAMAAAYAAGEKDVQPLGKSIENTHVRAVTLVTGLGREDFVSQVLVETDGIASTLLQQRVDLPLKREDLAVIPRDATLAFAGRVNPNLIAATLQAAAKDSDAHHGDGIADEIGDEIADQIGGVAFGLLGTVLPEQLLQDLPTESLIKRFKIGRIVINQEYSEELAASLGDTWRVYTSPSEGCSVFNSVTAVVNVKDRDRLARLFEKLASRVAPRKKSDAKSAKAAAAPAAEWAVRKSRFAEQDVYYLVRGGNESLGVLTWCLTKDGLVCSLSPQNIKAYLLREAETPSLADEPAAVEAIAAKNAPTIVLYEDTREMFRLTYPLMQGVAMSVAANAALPTGGIDPMLMPAAPTIAKYLRPAASTVAITPKGVHVTLHQSLPNGNLGATLYVMLCSLLPANANCWSGFDAGQGSGKECTPYVKSEEPKAAPFVSFTEKEGPCVLKKGSAFDKDVPTVEIGKNIQGTCKFYISDFIGRTIINANMSVKNTSKERRNCQYYVAFFDKKGKLIGCADQGLGDGLDAGADTQMGSCLIFLPDGMAETVTSYKVRFYETDKMPPKKK